MNEFASTNPGLIPARAIENQCFVLAAAQFGRHNDRRESFGHSLAINPWGKILADAGGYPCDGSDSVDVSEVHDPPTVVTCEIDLEIVDATRQQMPLDQHRTNGKFSFGESE